MNSRFAFCQTARSFPHKWFSSAARGSEKNISEQAVVRATELWIHEVVAKHGICPFAAKSKYEIVVSSRHNNYSATKALVIDRAKKLAAVDAKTGANLSTVIFFPDDIVTDGKSVYEDMIRDSNGRIGHMIDDYEPQSHLMKVQAVLFSGGASAFSQLFYAMGGPCQIQATAPWPTIQLLRYQDLKLARGKDGMRGEFIRKKNVELDASLPDPDKIAMIQACVDQAEASVSVPQLKVIRITKALSQEETERLEREGIQVELVQESSSGRKGKRKK
jgi:hypothetical protein